MVRLGSKTFLVAIAGVLLSMPDRAPAQIPDSADPVPWMLDFELDRLRSIDVRNDAGDIRTVWYLTYELTNATGAERPVALYFRVRTDSDKVSHETAPVPEAEKRLEERLQKDLKNSKERPDTLGTDESFEGIAFLGELDPHFDHLTIEVTGLEDVVYRVGPKRFFRKRALVLEWKRPGDEYQTYRDPLQFVKRSWKVVGKEREIR